jgi:hypothetical protein
VGEGRYRADPALLDRTLTDAAASIGRWMRAGVASAVLPVDAIEHEQGRRRAAFRYGALERLHRRDPAPQEEAAARGQGAVDIDALRDPSRTVMMCVCRPRASEPDLDATAV